MEHKLQLSPEIFIYQASNPFTELLKSHFTQLHVSNLDTKMATESTNLQQAFQTCNPVEEAITRNLNRSDLRNLRLAGIRVSASPQLQNAWLIPTQCDELGWLDKTPCNNSTENVDEIRPCEGYPPTYLVNPFVGGPGNIEKWSEPRNRKICAGLHSSTPEWKISEPLHRNICKPCRDRDTDLRHHQAPSLLANSHPEDILTFRTPLCDWHSHDQQLTQHPHNVCHCSQNINGKWRCNRCCDHYVLYLIKLAEVFRRRYASSETLVPISETEVCSTCPIPGCERRAWFRIEHGEKIPEQWQQCLGCTAIFSL